MHTAPLKSYAGYSWYDPPLSRWSRNFSLVVCDGPPADTPGGRYGLAPIMREHLAPGCVILLDDAEREPEREIAQRWSAELDAPSKSSTTTSRSSDWWPAARPRLPTQVNYSNHQRRTDRAPAGERAMSRSLLLAHGRVGDGELAHLVGSCDHPVRGPRWRWGCQLPSSGTSSSNARDSTAAFDRHRRTLRYEGRGAPASPSNGCALPSARLAWRFSAQRKHWSRSTASITARTIGCQPV
jgi:hypothetical protein